MLFFITSKGTKSFCNDKGTGFGWKVIFDLYTHKCSRRDAGSARMVPKLCESYVLHDSWTKLKCDANKNYAGQFTVIHLCAFSFIIFLARSFIRVVQPH